MSRWFLVAAVMAIMIATPVGCRKSDKQVPTGTSHPASELARDQTTRPREAVGRPTTAADAKSPFKALEAGLELAELDSPVKSDVGDSKIRVLRIDPGRFEFRLLCASATSQPTAQTARQWCKQHDLVAAINASMFAKDGRTSVALMQSRNHVNNPRATADKALLAFDSLKNNVAAVQVADLSEAALADLRKQYGTLVQSIRMVSAKGKSVWKANAGKKWSMAGIGMDSAGRILFVHVRSPYAMSELGPILTGLPIALRTLMYVEGGPEAQMFIQSDQVEMEFVGSYETGFRENDSNASAWPIPNVIGIVRLRSPTP